MTSSLILALMQLLTALLAALAVIGGTRTSKAVKAFRADLARLPQWLDLLKTGIESLAGDTLPPPVALPPLPPSSGPETRLRTPAFGVPILPKVVPPEDPKP